MLYKYELAKPPWGKEQSLASKATLLEQETVESFSLGALLGEGHTC